MKKLLYTVAFVALGFATSYAQRPAKSRGTAEERAEKAATAMQQKLSLNDEQKSKIKQIELDRFKQHDALHQKDEAAMKAKFEARKAEMKAHQDKIDAVLTPEQRTKLAASREEMRGKMKERFKERKGRPQKAPKVESN